MAAASGIWVTIALLVGVMVTLGIVLPIAITQSDRLASSDTVQSWQGDPWGGNTRARYAHAPADEILFPLHNAAETSFVARHRCPGICIAEPATLGSDERALSNSIFAQPDAVPDPRGLSSFAPFWGQWIAHDLALTNSNPADAAFSIDMTDLGTGVAPLVIHRLRAEFGAADGCRNLRLFVTPYMDGSAIYADYLNPRLAASLREGEGGRLRVTPLGFLPRHPDRPNEFLAGDVRASETAILSVMHTVWVKQHNRVADLYRSMNPMLDDNQLFWKARRAVVAQLQRITYEEYLPALLGSEQYAQYFGPDLATACAYNTAPLGPNQSLLKTEFAISAFRMHTLVPNDVGPFSFVSLFFNATKVEEIGLRTLVHAAASQPSQRFDAKVVDALRNTLFGTIGLDLVAINLARVRDARVASYETLGECYGFPTNATGDFYTQAQLEPLAGGSSVSASAASVISRQFLDLCQRDPFFYTREQARFDIGSALYKKLPTVTLKQVLVDNSDANPQLINDNAFFLPGGR